MCDLDGAPDVHDRAKTVECIVFDYILHRIMDSGDHGSLLCMFRNYCATKWTTSLAFMRSAHGSTEVYFTQSYWQGGLKKSNCQTAA